MVMEFSQYQVDQWWYRLYLGAITGFSLIIAAIYMMGRYVPWFSDYAALFAVNSASFVGAAAILLYAASAYWIITKRNAPAASLIGSMLFATTLLNGLVLVDSAQGAVLYVAAWLAMVFFAGMYGPTTLAMAVFLAYVFVALQSDFYLADAGPVAWLLLGLSGAVAILAYLFWQTRFLNSEDQKLNQLSGMLRTNQRQSEILMRSITDGIIVINTSCKITLMNPAAAAMTAWPINEALGVDAPLVVKLNQEDGSELESGQDPFTLVLTQMQQSRRIFQLQAQDGKKPVISLAISPILLAGDNRPVGAVAVMRDISEERTAEKQRAEFISTASHEMRTPVAAIEGYLALALNDKVSAIDSRAHGYLEKAHASTQHLGKLFQDLLTSSKAEDGRLSNHPVVVEMGAFMQQLTDDLKFTAEKKGLTAEFVIGGADETIDATTKDASVQHLLKPLYYVMVDPDRMREVLTNLFDNACKYTDSGKISIGLTGNMEVVQLYVRDTGAGIPAEDIPHLFQKFYRVDNSATRTIGGTGLGLFISRKIIELYNGRIWVESEVGKGSTFFINLPRLSAQHVMEAQASADALATSASTTQTTTITPGNS